MQTRKKSKSGFEAEDDLWQDCMEHIDKRFVEFKQKDLKSHYTLLKNWKSSLSETRSWYTRSTDRFQTFVNNIIKRQAPPDMKDGDDVVDIEGNLTSEPIEQDNTDPCHVVAHDHTYSRHPDSAKRTYVPHQCGSLCFMDMQLQQLNISPLQVPLLMGWQREVLKRQLPDEQLDAVYIAPCGRKLRSQDEVRLYLDLTCALYLKGLHFTFDPYCSLLSVPYDLKDSLAYLDDISEGKEKTPISCVNTFSEDLPDKFDYITKCSCEPNVPSAMPMGFLVCCDCLDDCVDRSKCACWQLTLEEARLVGVADFSVGYVHHRLKRPQLSAVYECHSNCVCGERCSNRVVQGGTRHRLQVFHTGHPLLRWAVRTLDDIPEGTFVCSYIGHIHKEMDADKVAEKHGDEYFADLDYMEVVERHKAHYEPAVDVRLMESSSGGDCKYRFSRKTSGGSSNMSSSIMDDISGSATPGESAVSGCGSSMFTNLSKLDSLMSSGALSRGTSPLSSLSSPSFLSLEETCQHAATQPLSQATPLYLPTAKSSLPTTLSSLPIPESPPTAILAPPTTKSSTAHTAGSVYPSSRRTDFYLSISSPDVPHPPDSADSTSSPDEMPSIKCYITKEKSTDSTSSPKLPRPPGLSDSTSSIELPHPFTSPGSTSSIEVQHPPPFLDSTSSVPHPPRLTGATSSLELPLSSGSPISSLSKLIPKEATPETTPTYLALSPMSSPASLSPYSPLSPVMSPGSPPQWPPPSLVPASSSQLLPDTTKPADPIPCPLYLALSPGHTPPPSPHNADSNPSAVAHTPLQVLQSPNRCLSSSSLQSNSEGSQIFPPDQGSPNVVPVATPLLYMALSPDTSPSPGKVSSSSQPQATMSAANSPNSTRDQSPSLHPPGVPPSCSHPPFVSEPETQPPNYSNSSLLPKSPYLSISSLASSPPLSPTRSGPQSKECTCSNSPLSPCVLHSALPPPKATRSAGSTKCECSYAADGKVVASSPSAGNSTTVHENKESQSSEVQGSGVCQENHNHHFRTRNFFHEEFVYFMDAKDKGNVGRFLNHSCSPNLFVQNVFVDSHDLRFPWVAFFAARKISAMEELTWDYNYEIGSVENKLIQCLCGAPNCRKRLL